MSDFNLAVEALLTAPFILGSILVAIYAIGYVARKDKIRRTREELTAATLHHVTRCGARSPEGWFCDRAAGHDGVHTDSTKGGELGAARWGWAA